MKNIIVAIKMFFLMSFITGIVYPFSVTLYGFLFTKEKSVGSFILKNNTAIGSELIAQKFKDAKYFWNRPSAVDYNPMSSGASNLGPTRIDLKNQVENRRKDLIQFHEGASANEDEISIPQDLLFASGSGLDPHISPEAAIYQALRISKVRNLDVRIVFQLIDELTEKPQYGIFGESRVNTLKANLALDQLNN